jgi:hypothetical protein
LKKWLGGFQDPSGHISEEISLFALQGIEQKSLGRLSPRIVTIVTKIYQLHPQEQGLQKLQYPPCDGMRCLQCCGSVFPQYKTAGEVAACSRRTNV